MKTLLRKAEYASLGNITLSGRVLDLGGEPTSDYHALFEGEFTITTANLPQVHADIACDLEKPLPVKDAGYDAVLLINVLEHVYNTRQLLGEAARVLKPAGTLVVVVPFLFPLHPSPKDFWRFSREALTHLLTEAGFKNVHITSLGSGVFATRYVALDRLMPGVIRFLGFYTTRYVVAVLDKLFAVLARALHKKYDPAHYALGYLVEAQRP